MTLEDLQPDGAVRGILPDATVAVVSVTWHGSNALTLVYRGPNAGHGACWLRDPRIAKLVEDALLHFDGERYRLIACASGPITFT